MRIVSLFPVQKSQMDAFNTSPSVSPRQPVALVAASNECACNDDIVKKHSETMSDLKLQIEKLSNQDELLMHNISTMLLTQKAIDTTTRKVNCASSLRSLNFTSSCLTNNFTYIFTD